MLPFFFTAQQRSETHLSVNNNPATLKSLLNLRGSTLKNTSASATDFQIAVATVWDNMGYYAIISTANVDLSYQQRLSKNYFRSDHFWSTVSMTSQQKQCFYNPHQVIKCQSRSNIFSQLNVALVLHRVFWENTISVSTKLTSFSTLGPHCCSFCSGENLKNIKLPCVSLQGHTETPNLLH